MFRLLVESHEILLGSTTFHRNFVAFWNLQITWIPRVATQGNDALRSHHHLDLPIACFRWTKDRFKEKKNLGLLQEKLDRSDRFKEGCGKSWSLRMRKGLSFSRVLQESRVIGCFLDWKTMVDIWRLIVESFVFLNDNRFQFWWFSQG